MINTPIQLRPDDTADKLARQARRRYGLHLFRGIVLALLVAVSFVALEKDTVILPLVLLLAVVIGVILWQDPRTLLYLVFGSVCTFELFQTDFKDALTDKVPFFWNVNTIFQVYAHMQNFKAIPLNLFELLLVITGSIAFVRAVYTGSARTKLGPLFYPILGYIVFVTIGWAHGVTSGGDFKVSLMEVRAQFYLMLAYLMGYNIMNGRKELRRIQWIMVLCIGLKGILYTFRRYVTIAGQPLPDQGVGSHEEAFLFNTFAVMLIVLTLCKVEKHLQRWMWVLLPFVITGNMATNRRAGTAALVIAIPALALAAYIAFPKSRRTIAIVGIVCGIVFYGYYQAFRNSDSLYAQPAHAIKSQFQPDERDASSNLYRDQENVCLMTTVKSSPWLGHGYGKKMIHAVPMADISKTYEYWDVMTHNQILWVWMRVGTFGFIAFWIMVASIIIYAAQMLRQEDLFAEGKAVALFTILITFMLMVFGGLDLQFSNQRDMLFEGFWCGFLVAVPKIAASAAAEDKVESHDSPKNPKKRKFV